MRTRCWSSTGCERFFCSPGVICNFIRLQTMCRIPMLIHVLFNQRKLFVMSGRKQLIINKLFVFIYCIGIFTNYYLLFPEPRFIHELNGGTWICISISIRALARDAVCRRLMSVRQYFQNSIRRHFIVKSIYNAEGANKPKEHCVLYITNIINEMASRIAGNNARKIVIGKINVCNNDFRFIA